MTYDAIFALRFSICAIIFFSPVFVADSNDLLRTRADAISWSMAPYCTAIVRNFFTSSSNSLISVCSDLCYNTQTVIHIKDGVV